MHIQEETLDPADWEEFRALSHQIVDDAIDYLRDVRDRPVWQSPPRRVQAAFETPLPQEPTRLDQVYRVLRDKLMPYPMGNIHPRFWMWFMGSSNATGALGDFLAAIVGSSLGGGAHPGSTIDQQVVGWCKQMVGYPESASGTLVTGGSLANMICLTVARNRMSSGDLRTHGVAAEEMPLSFYASDQVHSCHQKGLEVLGLGNNALRKIASTPDLTVDIDLLRSAIKKDRAAGRKPACVIATAGTVNTGAIDDLGALAELCKSEGIWLHIDGCIGALIAIAPENRHRVAGIEAADSIAMDPHKWLHAPFDVGCALVRDAQAHLETFALRAEYLEMTTRGVASGPFLFEYGIETSRGFRALKVWMALQEHGVRKFGRLIDQNIAQARYLTELIESENKLDLTVPTIINIVCFRYDPGQRSEDALKALNTEIMLRMQESGVAAVSDTTVHGRYCLRAAITNHRTRRADLDLLVAETLRQGDALVAADAG